MKLRTGWSIRAGLLLLLAAWATRSEAGITVDPANDFLPSYVGATGGDLDVIGIEVTYDGTEFVFTATMNADIGTTAGALYVWGIDRGQGTARFPVIAPGVLFDSVVLLRPDATGVVNRIVGGGTDALTAAEITISGATITARVAASFLPTLGSDPSDYTFNLWPRLGTGNENQISDFAPDNSNIRATLIGPAAAPEPTTLASGTIAALVGLAAAYRNRKSRRVF